MGMNEYHSPCLFYYNCQLTHDDPNTKEDCDDVDPTQTMHLTTDDLKESAEPMPLQFVKYQRVKSVTLFVEDNQGGDITALGSLKFFGRPVVSTNMSEFKKTQE